MNGTALIEAIIDDARIVQRLGRCTRLRGGSSCAACAEACPRGIPLSAGGNRVFSMSHGELCTACGACVAACPTEALALSGSQVALWVSALRDLDREQPGVLIGCSAAGAPECDLEVFCLRGWDESLALWTAACFSAVARVDIVTGDCSDCTEGEGDCGVAEWVELSAAALATLGDECQITHVIRGVSSLQDTPHRNAGLSRRSFFRSLFSSGRERIAHVQGRGESGVAADEEGAGTVGERRRLALAALRRIAQRTPTHGQLTCGTPGRLSTLVPAADEDACVACGDCVKFCPTGALGVAEADGTWSLHLNMGDCVGCGQCERLCRTQGLRLNQVTLTEILTERDVALAAITVVPCTRCGQAARADAESALCETCRRAESRFRGLY